MGCGGGVPLRLDTQRRGLCDLLDMDRKVHHFTQPLGWRGYRCIRSDVLSGRLECLSRVSISRRRIVERPTRRERRQGLRDLLGRGFDGRLEVTSPRLAVAHVRLRPLDNVWRMLWCAVLWSIVCA